MHCEYIYCYPMLFSCHKIYIYEDKFDKQRCEMQELDKLQKMTEEKVGSSKICGEVTLNVYDE